MAHQELGYELIKRITEQLKDEVVVEQPPQMAGRNLSIAVECAAQQQAASKTCSPNR